MAARRGREAAGSAAGPAARWRPRGKVSVWGCAVAVSLWSRCRGAGPEPKTGASDGRHSAVLALTTATRFIQTSARTPWRPALAWEGGPPSLLLGSGLLGAHLRAPLPRTPTWDTLGHTRDSSRHARGWPSHTPTHLQPPWARPGLAPTYSYRTHT